MARNVINLENVVGYAKYGDDYTNIIEEQRKKKKKQQEKEDSWTDFSAFEDGYQLGDVTKAILGTGVKTGQNFTKGLQSNLEGLLDFGTNIASMGTEALGLNNATEKLRNFAQKDFIAENDLVNKTLINTNPMLALLNQGLGAYDNLRDGYDPGDLLVKNNQIATLFKGQGTLSKGLDKIASNSITGNKLDSLAQTVGQISGQAALGSTGIPWQLTAFANSAGGEMNNAFQNNATAGQAFISGLISGAVEVGTEYIGSGANKLLGMESLGSKGLAKLGSKISNKVVNRLLKIGIDASSEGLEEVLSGLGTAIGQKLTYMNDKELEELYSKDQALDDFIMGALGTVITNVPGQVQSIRRGENALSGLTENEQTVLDKVIEQRTNEAQKDGKELTKKQLNEIEEQAREDLQNGYISADTIEETLGDNYNADKDVMLRESFNERARRRTNFNTDLNQYKDENQRKIVQKAIDSGILNDSKKTHNFVDLVSKIAADKGMDFDFVNNQKIKDSGFGVEGKTVNGYVNGNTIGLNIESNNALNKTVGHEITHVLEGSDMYQALQDSLRSYVGEGEWQSRLKSLSETYKNVENADVTKELTADLVGENLFNNENFVRSLSTKDRNLFEKIYDEIKYLVKVATAGSKEKRDLVKLQKVFQEVYRDSKTTKEGTQYSIEGKEEISLSYAKQRFNRNMGKYSVGDNLEDAYLEHQLRKEELDSLYEYAKKKAYNDSELKELERRYNELVERDNPNQAKYSLSQDEINNTLSNNGIKTSNDIMFDEESMKYYQEHNQPSPEVLSKMSRLSDFVNEHKSDFDDIENRPRNVNSGYYFVGDNIVKLSTTLEGDKLYIDELYVEKQKQGAGTKVVEALKQYANENNLEIEPFKELSTAKGFWDKALNRNTKYSLTDNQGRELSKEQQEYFKNSKVRDNDGRLLEVYHGTPNAGFTIYDNTRLGETSGADDTSLGFHLTDNIELASFFSGIVGDETYNKAKQQVEAKYDINEDSIVPFQEMAQINQEIRETAEQIAKEQGEVKHQYLNIEKPLSVFSDYGISNEQLANDIVYAATGETDITNITDYYDNNEDFLLAVQQNFDDELAQLKDELAKPEAIERIKELGYDGLILPMTSKDQATIKGTGKEYIVFNSEQIKNTDNTDPTSNPDIRYSLSEAPKQDNQGRELTLQQQDFYKNVAPQLRDENGNIKTFYHGTPAGDFTVFREGSYFSDREEYATGYQNTWASSISSGKEATNPKTYEVYLNITNPFSLSNPAAKDIYLNEYIKGGNSAYYDPYTDYTDTINQLDEIDWVEGEDLKEWLQENHPEFDGLILDEGGDGGYGEAEYRWRGLSYLPFRSNQVKNVDNTNPTDNPDIRYSLSEDAETFTTPYGVEVVKNPSNDDYIEMRKEILDEYPWLRGQEPILRHTYDEEGNEYYWSAYDAQHASVEPYINKKYNTRTNQNDGWWKRDNKNDYPKDYSWMDLSNFNPDTKYQLGTNDIAPTRGWEVKGEDIRLQNAIAPLQEQVQQLQNTLDEVKNNIAPLEDSLPAISEEEASQLGSQFNENDIAPIRDNLTEYESKRLDFLDRLERENMLTENLAEERNELMAKEENAPELGKDMTPIESLNDVRDMDEAARDRSVNAYQYEHPEVKPYFQEEARILKSEINNVIPGERFMIEGRDYEHPTKWYGYKRQASEDVANLLDGYTLGTKYTKDQLIAGLDAIIEDHGLENKAVSKRLEFMLDDRLRNGYETIEGYQIEPNQDYLNMLKEQSWDKYYDEAPIEEAPNDIRYSAEDEFDLAPFEPQERDVMEMVDNEGYRKSTTQNRPPIPYKQKSGLRQTVDAIKSGIVNRNVEIDNLSRDSGNRNIKFYGDMMNGAMGEVSYDIGTAQTNNKGETIGKSIKALFEKAKKQGLGAAFNDFLINYSNIDRYTQNKGSQTPLEVSKRLVRDYAIKYPEFKQWAKDVWTYGKNARQNLVDAGLIDQQLADYLGEIYPHYVPYVSDYENADRYFEGVGELIPKGLKRAKGNAGKLLSVEDALSKYTYAQKMAIRQNELYKEIVHTLGQIPNFGVDERTDYTDMRDSLYTDSRGNYLTAYENGKQITTQVSKDLFKELSRTTENQLKDVEKKLSLITKPLQGVSKLRKSLITTWNPTFPVTNAIKDLQDALFNSKHTKDMVKNYLGAVKELATGKGKEVNQFLALYGSGLTMGEYSSDGLNKLSEKIPLINTIKQINEVVELAPRYAEFKASLQNGESLQEAIYNAREVTTNFNRGGTIAKAMNRNGFTFLNASIQGFDKFIRNFSGQNGAKGIVQAMAKVAALGIAPALFNHLAYDDDEEYEGLKDYIKDNYYLIKTDEGKFIRIPKGRMLSIFGSAARRALESSSGEENAFEGYLGNAWNQIGINDPGENNVFAPFIQAFGSKNGTAWYGGDIVPSRLQSEKPENQYDEKTDRFSIWLGDKLGVSPKKINYALDQYLGGIGDVLLPMGTEAASSDAESVGEYLTAPIKDKFTADSVEDSKYSSDFYTVKNSIPHGENATDEEQLQYKYMNGISWELTELYKQKREVQSNPDLTKKEKYQQAKEIQREINEKAKQGLEDYKNVDISGNYATINGIKYKKGSDGKWTKQRK